MAPEFAYGRHRGPVSVGVHRAAVCLCVLPDADQWWIPLTVRSKQLSDHGGQISLPGGRLETDEGAFQAARREFREELGTALDEGTLLGMLTPLYVYGSHHYVEVCVAALDRRPDFSPDAQEVAEAILLPVRSLLNAEDKIVATMQRGTARYEAPAYRYAGHIIWGATAMILAEFAEVVRRAVRR